MKNVILVAGVDYEFKGVDFRIFCDNRVKRLLANDKTGEEMTFQIFDFRRGEVVTNAVTFPGGKKTEKISKLSPSPFTSISQANYDRVTSGGETKFHFKNGQSDKMSIVNIYEAVQKIGKDAPGTLVELSLFSHAWYGGPILVNSFDDNTFTITVPLVGAVPVALPPGVRDPDDKDPRHVKDFVAPTMDATALDLFQKAFHTDGFSWIWGCTFPRTVHEILHKVERNSAYKDSGVGDDQVFSFTNFNTDQATYLESQLLAELGAPFPDKKKIEIKFKLLKRFFCKMTIATYAHHLAVKSKKKVFAGVMGTYSEYDTGPQPLMSVHKGFARHFTFYKNYLGFDFDPEGRKYGEYKPGFSCPPP